jgi:hypothetical protein
LAYAHGYGVRRGERLHQLVRKKVDVRERPFKIDFVDPGAEAFAFTFGRAGGAAGSTALR